MTKYLVKIISICAFVVLIPVIIAGVALSAIGSTKFELNTYISGVVAENSKATYSLTMGEKEGDKTAANTGAFLNGTEVGVNAELTGYDFVGWFDGDDKTFDKNAQPLSTNPSYTFEIKKDTQLTALVSLKQYYLVFQGQYPNGNQVNIDKNGIYTYGQELPTLEATEGAAFAGWFVVSVPNMTEGEDDAALPKKEFTDATFDSVSTSTAEKAYILEPSWTGRVRISYRTFVDGQEREFYSESLTKEGLENFEFLSQENQKFTDALGAGYEFVNWVNEGQAVLTQEEIRATDFSTTRSIVIYLSKQAINYTINVKKFADSTEVTDKAALTYNVDEGFGKLNLTRNYYEIDGLKVNGTDYAYDKETNTFEGLPAVITASSETTLEAVAIWKCKYETVSVVYNSIYTDGIARVYKYTGTEFQQLTSAVPGDLNRSQPFTVSDTDGIKLEQLIQDVIIPEGDLYVNLTEGDIDISTATKVQLKEIVLYVNGVQGAATLTVSLEDADIAYLIELLETENNTFKVDFIFEAKAE